VFKSMRTKKCVDCGEVKLLTEFYKNKNCKKGVLPRCKCCNHKKYGHIIKENQKIYRIKCRPLRKTNINYFINRMWENIRCRSSAYGEYGERKFERCSMEKFKNFAKANNVLKCLFNDWVKSGYEYRLTPTTDRIDNKKGYLVENIQFLSMSDNAKKRAK